MRRRRAKLVPLALGLLAAGVLITVSLPAAHGGLTAQVTEPAASYGAGAVVLSATANSSTCATSTSTITANANTNCSSTLFPAALNSGSASSSITINNNGNLTAKSVYLTSGSTCGVLSSADDSTGGGNSAILAGGVQSSSSSYFSGTNSMAFDGSSGYLQTEQDYNDPTTYSLMAWFKTPSGASGGGSIIGFDTSQSNAYPTTWDRQIFVNASGKVVFALGAAATDELISPSTYNDGNWHFVVATESTSGGAALYIDGSSVASNSSYKYSLNYVGWWHIGWANSIPWPNPPHQNYFNGDLANVAVFPSALSAAAVTTLYGAGSQSAEQTDTLADSPTSYWPLTSNGEATSGAVQTNSTTVTDLAGNGNTATPQGTVATSSAAPFTDGGSLQFDGSTGYMETADQQTDPETFSVAGWFKTVSGVGGTVIGFANTQSDSSPSDWDRQIWVDNSGKVVFGVWPGDDTQVTSSNSYDDGNWHFVVAELSSAGQKLYVDNTLVASSSDTAAQTYSGYWHLGWGNEVNGWTDPPSSAFFDGELSDMAVFPTALSTAQMTAIYGATSQAGEQTAVLAASPTYYWPMSSYVTENYCNSETVETTIENDTVSGSPSCLDPYAAGACGTGTSEELSALTNEAVPLPNISAGSDDVIKLSLTDSANSLSGVHFAIPLTLSASAGSFTGSLAYPATTPSQTFTG